MAMNFLFQLKTLIPLYTFLLAVKHGYLKAWKIVVSQFKFETANFTDYKSDDPVYNICGMRPANVRPQNRTGELNGYATFSDYWDCINDFFERNKVFNIKDTDDVSEWTKSLKDSKYFEANLQQYNKGVQHYLDVDGSDYNRTIVFFIVGLCAIVGGVVYLFYHFAKKKAGINIGRYK